MVAFYKNYDILLLFHEIPDLQCIVYHAATQQPLLQHQIKVKYVKVVK